MTDKGAESLKTKQMSMMMIVPASPAQCSTYTGTGFGKPCRYLKFTFCTEDVH
jgi:hypothetical protein